MEYGLIRLSLYFPVDLPGSCADDTEPGTPVWRQRPRFVLRPCRLSSERRRPARSRPPPGRWPASASAYAVNAHQRGLRCHASVAQCKSRDLSGAWYRLPVSCPPRHLQPLHVLWAGEDRSLLLSPCAADFLVVAGLLCGGAERDAFGSRGGGRGNGDRALPAGSGPRGSSSACCEPGGEPALVEAQAGPGSCLPDERDLHASGSSWRLRAIGCRAQGSSRDCDAACRPARPSGRLAAAPAAAPWLPCCADDGSGESPPTHDGPCPSVVKASRKVPGQGDGGLSR